MDGKSSPWRAHRDPRDSHSMSDRLNPMIPRMPVKPWIQLYSPREPHNFSSCWEGSLSTEEFYDYVWRAHTKFSRTVIFFFPLSRREEQQHKGCHATRRSNLRPGSYKVQIALGVHLLSLGIAASAKPWHACFLSDGVCQLGREPS